ncbi:MAG: ATP-binding protein [Leptospirales bacterium]|nr:ATP-binding protein [Leptospirales bacterium]
MWLQRLLRGRTLARDLALALMAAVSLTLAILGLVVYLVLAADQEMRLSERTAERADRLAEVLSLPMWNLDEDSIRRIGRAYSDSSDIARIEVRDESGAVYDFGPQPAPGSDFVVEREIRLRDQRLGQVRVFVTRNSVRNLRLTLFSATMAFVAASIATILIVTNFLLRRLLLAPLAPVKRGLQLLSEGAYQHRIEPSQRLDVDEIIAGINTMAERIQKRDAELRESERKYRFLVEDSGDIIFALNAAGEIATINQAVRRLLGRSISSTIGIPFVDLLYRSGTIRDLLRMEQIVQTFQQLSAEKPSIKVNLELGTAQNEPREMIVQFERVTDESGATLTFGKAMAPFENLLAKHTERESRRFVIGNYVSMADLVLDAITSNLSRYCDEDTAYAVKAGVKEMLMNAIEHGNLAISFDEKHRSTSEGTHFQLIKQRQQHPDYRKRTVTVVYSLRPERVLFVIRDQGAGFDHRTALQREQVDADRYHGRGILLTRQVFDVIRYNETGNQVTLMKRFGPPRDEARNSNAA